MDILILVSTVVTFSALGVPQANYVASAEKIPHRECLIIKKAMKDKATVLCIKVEK